MSVDGPAAGNLDVNGASKGFGEQSNRFLFTFKDIEWQPGAIQAVGYDARNRPGARTFAPVVIPTSDVLDGLRVLVSIVGAGILISVERTITILVKGRRVLIPIFGKPSSREYSIAQKGMLALLSV